MKYDDTPSDIRAGEELDIPALEKFLKENIPGLEGKLTVKQYPSGYSNLTYQINFGEKELILRRPPAGKKAKSAHDMGREFRMISSLISEFPYCPRPVIYCGSDEIIGTEFYVMEKIKGIILRKDLPEGLDLLPEDAGKLCRNMVGVLCRLHDLDYQKIGLDNHGNPEGYVKRQVEGWSKRYRDARTPDAPDFEGIMKWLDDKMPPDAEKSSVIHNDFKFDNLVLNPNDPTEILGVLDWEMSTIGHPLMDLGSSLAYWVDRDDPDGMQLIRMLPTNIKGALTRRQILEYYTEISGRETAPFDFFYCFGLFRLAVIAQQIYYRYYHGQTKDKRFKQLIFAVNVLEQGASRLIARSPLN